MDFIRYGNEYGYHDRNDSDCNEILLLRDNKTGRFYQDNIKYDACSICEPFCSWSSRKNMLSKSDVQEGISAEDIKAYNSIHSDKIYGRNETRVSNRKTGIQLYLNDAFKFSQPTKTQLDSLFYHYDDFYHHQYDTLLGSPNELYGYLREQAEEIRSFPDYGDRNHRLEFLKSQVNLLLLQDYQPIDHKFFFWIYKNGSSLRTRRLSIFGNEKSSYTYILDEEEICF